MGAWRDDRGIMEGWRDGMGGWGDGMGMGGWVVVVVVVVLRVNTVRCIAESHLRSHLPLCADICKRMGHATKS